MPRITNRIDVTPGFYQGRQQGLKSGRTSPRDAVRPSRSDMILARHGIVSSGSIDPHQGQLFNTQQIPAIPQAELVRRAGGPAADPLASHKGFMPALATHKQKVAGINRLAESRTRTGADRGTGAPVKEAMEDRAAVYGRAKDRPWYARMTAAGHIDSEPGQGKTPTAGDLVSDVAMRQGVSQGRAARAVAITSPRTAWDEVNAGPAGHSGGMHRPNINSAESVMSVVNSLGPDPAHLRVVEASGSARGKALGAMMIKAGVEYAKGEPNQPIPVSGVAASKVPNFEQGIHLDNPSKAVQEQSSRSYTVDVHDTRSFGGDETMLKTGPGYHIAAMTGRRAALKQWSLGPIGQGDIWDVVRGDQAPESMGQHGLFRQTRSGNILPHPRALPGVVARKSLAEGGSDDRSPTAKRLGIEF